MSQPSVAVSNLAESRFFHLENGNTSSFGLAEKRESIGSSKEPARVQASPGPQLIPESTQASGAKSTPRCNFPSFKIDV